VNIVRLGWDSEAQYFLDIARLHERELKAGLLAKLGPVFLSDFYRYVAADRDSVVLAAVDGKHAIGFVSGTVDIGRFYHRFLLHRGFRLAWHLVPYLLRRGSLSRIGSFRTYLSRGRSELPSSELTSLAVDSSIQRSGVGKALFRAFREDLCNRGIPLFKVSAATTQAAALLFYPALGARQVAVTRLGELELIVFVCPTAAVS
jgi:ribosomal protein S18 acetylase RimI-like enzyme